MNWLWLACTLAKALGWVVKKLAISGTASTIVFCKLRLLVKVKSWEVPSPGERIASVLVVDHTILG